MKSHYVAPQIIIEKVCDKVLQTSGLIDTQSLFDNVKPDKFGVYER